MKRTLTLITTAAILMGCSEKASPTPGTYEALVEEMCGDYMLTGIHWSGTPIDLNGDGTGYNDLVREFCNFNGYYEPNHIAEIAESEITGKNDDKVFGVSVMLPYPDIKTSEGKSFVASIEYLPLTIRATYIGGESRVATQYGPISFEHLPDDYTFLKSISEIMITDFENGELTVRIRCSLIDSKQEVKTDYIHYNYRRNY